MNKWIKEYQCTGCVNDGEDCYCKTEGAYQVILENCMNEFNCIEITEKDMKEMD